MRYIIILILAFLSVRASGQIEYMINGGFENIDISLPTTPPYIHPIWLAPPWNNLAGNTADVHHSGYAATSSIAGVPRTGNGNGRFVAAPSVGNNEYCYGATNALTAGETYIVSFWIRQDFSSSIEIPVGCIISETIPSIQASPFSSTHSPQLQITPTNTNYIKASFCYTAQNNGAHYISFGPWHGYGLTEAIGFYIDDVSVESLPVGTVLPVAGLTIPQSTYCIGDNITVNGNSTVDESGYIWEIYQVPIIGNEQLVYTSGNQTGQAGTFDVTSVIGSIQEGDCYRVYLTALGTCQSQTSVDFCYIDPTFDFIHDGSAICENTSIPLSVTGDNGWTYQWSTGDLGVGLKTVTVTPTIGNSTYTVTVTTTEGCMSTQTITLDVHSTNNLAPWMDGINGSGNYTVYVNQGDVVNFNSTLFNDNPIENITYTESNNLSSVSFNFPSQVGGVFSLNWQTTISTPTGEYYFNLNANDNNVCQAEVGTFTFTIIVICDHCPICVEYDNRTPTTLPLPSETKVGQCILAGWNGTVDTGTENVLFVAGDYISEGPNFTAGPGYQAIIEPTTCVTDCEDCCINWNGFTVDEIPNPPIISTIDSDPTNDIWQVTDVFNPFCAYGAMGFTLEIEDPAGLNIYSLSSFGGCCSFVSPAPENPISHASVWWDGAYDYESDGTPIYQVNATYFYILTFYGCGGQTLVKSGFIAVNPYFGLTIPNDPDVNLNSLLIDTNNVEGNNDEISNLVQEQLRLSELISIYPNPATDELFINGVDDVTFTEVQMFNQLGEMLTMRGQLSEDHKVVITGLSSGTYYLKIYYDGISIVKKFVKK